MRLSLTMHAPENGCLKFCDLNLLQRESEEDNLSLLQQSAKREFVVDLFEDVAFYPSIILQYARQ